MSAMKLDESADSLQMKLNLKKHIWTGAWNESLGERPRPLSWGHPVIKGNHHQYLEVREYDSEQLLIACSKKLADWQQNGNCSNQTTMGTTKKKNHNSSKQGKNAKHHQGNNNAGSVALNERRLHRDTSKGGGGRLQKGFHVSTASFINRCNITRITEIGKTKKLPQNYALAKIVEATDFITSGGLNNRGMASRGFHAPAQKKRHSLTPPQMPIQTTNGSHLGATFNNNISSSSVCSRPRKNPLTLKKRSKFKAGGIAVTAVQNHRDGPPKRSRSILPTETLISTGMGSVAEKATTTRTNAQLKNLVKRVKIKHKKEGKNKQAALDPWMGYKR